MEYSLRRVRTDELDWLCQLNEESYRDVVIRQFGSWEEDFQRKVFYDQWKVMRPAQIVVCGDARVGVVSVEPRKDYDWLQEIQIKTEYRGQGLGTSLMQRFVAKARSRNRPLRLQVLHQNHRAKLLYQRLGFVEIEPLESHFLMQIE